jgi:acyl-CoA synthetase (AMP-forming)/AMP-acid ligase II
MLSDTDLSLVRSFEQGQVTDCPFSTVTAAFYHHASSYPDAIAARDMSCSPAKELTYEELAAQAQSLAVKLRDLGVGPGDRVPLLVKRGLDMVLGIWAVLSCGAQYVPLDGGVVPETTIRTVVKQAGGFVVLCTSSTESRLRDLGHHFENLVPVLIDQHRESMSNSGDLPTGDTILDLATADGGCYVIYTSGKILEYPFTYSVLPSY